MERRIYNRLMGTAALAIVITLLLTTAVWFYSFNKTDNIAEVIEIAVPWLLLIMGILLVASIAISHFFSKALVQPIRLITEDVDSAEKMMVYEEMSPYIAAIKSKRDDVIQNALMRQEFTANVSHELKTPLAAISGYSELIENGMVASEEEVLRFAGEIHSNSNRLLTLINDVIRLSELDAEGGQELFEPVDLWDATQNCVNMLQMNAEKHHVTLNFEGESAMVSANKQMLEEVLYNLCDNAIRYNKEGGSVYVTVQNKSSSAILTVKDTGIGIPKEQQERVFERFYRVDKGRSKSTGGTGLGLAIVKHILLRLGASISLESELGVGTEITVTFPKR